MPGLELIFEAIGILGDLPGVNRIIFVSLPEGALHPLRALQGHWKAFAGQIVTKRLTVDACGFNTDLGVLGCAAMSLQPDLQSSKSLRIIADFRFDCDGLIRSGQHSGGELIFTTVNSNEMRIDAHARPPR